MSEQAGVLSADFYLIGALALISYFCLEKIWPGIIGNYFNPAWLIVYWLISFAAFCFFRPDRTSPMRILLGCLAAAAGLLYFKLSLGPWFGLLILVFPVVLLLISERRNEIAKR